MLRVTGQRVSGLRRLLRLAVLAALVLIPVFAHAQSLFRLVNLSYLARRAGVIVQGRVTNVKYEPLPGYEHIPTVRVTLQVEQMLRGPEAKQYTFRQMLPLLRPRPGKAGYQVGQELLLFLPSPSEYGLSSPLGHEQGTFHIARDSQGHKFIANEFNNGSLFKNLASDAAQEGLTLSEPQSQLISVKGGPVDLDGFVSLVRSLATLLRIE